MVSKSRHSVVLYGVIGFVLVCLGAVGWMQLFDSAEAATGVADSASVYQDVQSPDVTTDASDCTVNFAGAYPGSVLIRCLPAVGAIEWYAISTTDSGQANRVLSVALTAQAMNRRIGIQWDINDLTVPPYCDPNNCREIIWIHTLPN